MKNFEIKAKKIQYLYENLFSSLVAVFGLAVIIFFTFSGLVDAKSLFVWFALNIVVLLLRFFSLYRYKKTKITEDNLYKFYWIFTILAIINACLWGVGAFFILPVDVEQQMIMLLLITGIATGSTVSLASRLEIFYVYILFIVMPFVYFFYKSSFASAFAILTSLFLYLFVLLVLSKKISKSVNNNIALEYKNKALITELEAKVDEANIANRAKSEFLSVMSHEIRTPLNAIMGFVQILKTKEEDATKKKYLDTIDKSSKLLTNVINDILDISKIESGNYTLEKVDFSPFDEFSSLYLLYEQNSIQKGVKFVNSISNNLPKKLNSDILRIKQILSNLLSNALKFTPEGKEIELVVEFKKDCSSLYIEVKDSGIGISKENIKNITKAFVQADSSTARKYGGTGLGLSIVAKLLNLFNSELKIESELGVGSSFSFEIRVDEVR